ncbi:MAG: hypothetical protein RLZZ591_397 [Pseudomonadota bacterium]|jgi:hypothetical protein
MQTIVQQPWWKFAHVWMVIAGPLIVIVAGFFTLYLAIKTPDPVLTQEPRQTASNNLNAQSSPGMAPALQARNHAATGAPGTARP